MKARRIKNLDPDASLAANAARMAKVRLRELRSFAPAALAPEARTQQHDMRIAAKRLRYVLEIAGFCLGPAAKRAEAGARELQDLLGEIHDCDVMLPQVEGLETLTVYLQARRTLLFDRFQETWHEQEATGLWGDLVVAAKAKVSA